MGKRVRISNESLNSHGFRVLTSGIDLEQYRRNPVLLYMHERGQVIGTMANLAVEGDELTGEPVFDEASELSQRCKKQWELGSLKMVSMGFQTKSTSKKAEDLIEGQTRPTVTRCQLLEVSVVDVGSNNDSIVLVHEGETVNLGNGGVCPLEPINKHQNNSKEMDIQTLAHTLGLPDTADEAAVNDKLAALQAAAAENATLKSEKQQLIDAQLASLVETAIKERRLTPDKKEEYITLGKKLGAEDLGKVLGNMSPRVKAGDLIDKTDTGEGQQAQLAEGPWEARMREIRENLKR